MQQSSTLHSTSSSGPTTSKSSYTYLVRTDYYPEEFVDNLFKARGNWVKVHDKDIKAYQNARKRIDFIYIDGKYYLSPLYYSLISNLKNIVNDGKRIISFKNNLIANLSKIPEARQFIMPQVDVDLHVYTNPAEMANFDTIYSQLFFVNRVYIFKPVSGMGGAGIKIFTTFLEFKQYCMHVINKYKAKWGFRDPNKEHMRVFVFQEYITNPLLVKHAGADYKFHVRHFYLYQPGSNVSYYKNIGKMALAEEPYKHGDWFNAKIHDTHFHSIDRWLFTPEDTGISSENMAKINKQIHKFYKLLDKLVRPHAGCYPESVNCFELFGVDFMITQDYKLKVLEVNAGLGLSSNMTANKAELFKGIIELVVDQHFPPAKKQASVASAFTICS